MRFPVFQIEGFWLYSMSQKARKDSIYFNVQFPKQHRKAVPECQTILDSTAARDDRSVGGGGTSRRAKLQ